MAPLAEAGDSIETESVEETMELGERICRLLPRNGILLLYGEMGSGKTALVKGLGRALGVDAEEIQSPTFTLVHEYQGSGGCLTHVDLYRLSEEQVFELGLEEVLAHEGLKVIEWSERLAPELEPHGSDVVRLSLHDLGGDRRRIERFEPAS